MRLLKLALKKLLEYGWHRQLLTIGSHRIIAHNRHLDELNFYFPLVLQRLFNKHHITIVIDVGANEGQYGEFLRTQVGFTGTILSFEPTSKAFAVLSNRAKNDPQWKVFNFALGREYSQKTIHVSNLSVFSSFHESGEYSEKHFGNIASIVSHEQVAVKRLDSFLRDSNIDISNNRTFLKMDTQGFDLEVFAGLGDNTSKLAAIQSEVSLIPLYKEAPLWAESVTLFEQAGFGISGFFPVNSDGDFIIEYDCLMVNKNLVK